MARPEGAVAVSRAPGEARCHCVSASTPVCLLRPRGLLARSPRSAPGEPGDLATNHAAWASILGRPTRRPPVRGQGSAHLSNVVAVIATFPARQRTPGARGKDEPCPLTV